MYWGLVQLGNALFAMIVTKSGQVPTDADVAPGIRIYDQAGVLILNGIGTLTKGDQTGLYYFSKTITAADGYEAGKTYFASISYLIAASQRRDVGSFTVV